MKRQNPNHGKKIYRYTNAHSEETIKILQGAGALTNSLKIVCERVYDACDICARSGRPTQRRKISAYHVNKVLTRMYKQNSSQSILKETNSKS